ncbi:MAG: DUF5312 family protein [Treponemataceae bacterium]
MSFIESIKSFIENIFFSNKPEIKAKLDLRKLENELKSIQPAIYKDGKATANLGEVFFILYQESKKIGEILQKTLFFTEPNICNHYSEILIKTGYTGENLEKLKSLDFTSLKEQSMESKNRKRTFEEQQRTLGEVIKALNSSEFKKIEETIIQLERLNDICSFNYVSVIRLFDANFDPTIRNSHPTFLTPQAQSLEKPLRDLLYLSSNFTITAAQGRAIIALAEQSSSKSYSDEQRDEVMSSLRKISTIFNRILTKSNIQLYVKVIKQTPNMTFEEAPFKSNVLIAFSTRLQRQFTTNTDRIETELQDKRIERDLKNLFLDKPLVTVSNYNLENNNYFISISFPPFQWITPVQILKTFIVYYFSDGIQSLLNDIVVEGFFNNPVYKTEFAQKVFTCSEAAGKISEFEESFEKGKANDIAVMKSWGREANQNPDLGKKLLTSIETVNVSAHNLLQELVTDFSSMHSSLNLLIQDAHKANSDTISNLKILFSSSRNRDNVEMLEKQFEQWRYFFEIMRNYVVIKKIADN